MENELQSTIQQYEEQIGPIFWQDTDHIIFKDRQYGNFYLYEKVLGKPLYDDTFTLDSPYEWDCAEEVIYGLCESLGYYMEQWEQDHDFGDRE